MSINKLIVPGFGVGAFYGTPLTVGVAQTSTYTISAGQWIISGLPAGLAHVLYNNIASATNTYTIHAGAVVPQGGFAVSDGFMTCLQSTTTSVNVILIPLN